MLKLAAALATAGVLLAAPALTNSAKAEPLAGVKVAQADVTVRVGRDRHRHWDRRWHRHRVCRSTVTWRHGRKIVVRRCY